jgi:hypothetical protein
MNTIETQLVFFGVLWDVEISFHYVPEDHTNLAEEFDIAEVILIGHHDNISRGKFGQSNYLGIKVDHNEFTEAELESIYDAIRAARDEGLA